MRPDRQLEHAIEKYDRLKKRIQDSILRGFPNPERRGCPGEAVVREIASRPLDDPIENNPHWHHVTHCAECYREFLAFTNERNRRRAMRRLWVGWSLAALATFVLVGVIFRFVKS
jgi:hypothetical protein